MPTSILPNLTVMACGSFLWVKFFGQCDLSAVVGLVLGVVLGVACPLAFLFLLAVLSMFMHRSCAKCGGALEHCGGGFYDGCMPHPMEIVVYILSLLLPFLLY